MRHKVIEDYVIAEPKKVPQYSQDGYELAGSASYSTVAGTLMQPMVKYADNSAPKKNNDSSIT